MSFEQCVKCAVNFLYRIGQTNKKKYPLSGETDQFLEAIRQWTGQDNLKESHLCTTCWEFAKEYVIEGKPLTPELRYLPTSEPQFELAVLEDASLQDNSTVEVKEELFEEGELNHENKQDQFEVTDELMEVAEDVKEEYEPIDSDEKELDSKIPKANPILRCTKNGKKVMKCQTESVEDDNDPTYYPPASHNKKTEINYPQEDYIKLPNIRRAPSTTRYCLFDKCKGKERFLIPVAVRKRTLQDYNFFIPKRNRICCNHLKKRSFHELYAGTNTISHFNAEQIEQMVFMASQTSSVNLQTPETMQSDLFEYIFGVTPSEYEQIIGHFPQLNDHKIKCGMNALLCKFRTGDSDERLSKFFKIPRSTLKKYMNDVIKILKEVDFESYVKVNTAAKTIKLDENTGLLKDKSCCTSKQRNVFMALVKAVNNTK